MPSPDMSRNARLATYGNISTSLAAYSDRALAELLDAARPLGSGIGGTSALLDVGGTSVFVKQVPLTDLERQPEHVRSTANLFEMPSICHYGIGGPGFGAWRELAAHTMTTNWVLADEFDGFPLMYHWRVRPDKSPLPEELATIDRAVAYWGGSAQVRRRLEALEQSTASITYFLEYIPHNLHTWLSVQLKADADTAERACSMVTECLEAGVSFMNANDLLHFDAHFENILTDGRQLYFADYGLAISPRFELSPDEVDFVERHQTYDRSYAVNHMVNWLIAELHGYGRAERETQVRAYARGERPPAEVPAAAATALTRHSPVAEVMSSFLRALQHESRATPYPTEEISRLLEVSG